MKVKQEKNNAHELFAEAIPVNVSEQPKEWVVNCGKCGASLNVKNGKTAYICPVCGSLLRMRTGTRIVKDIPRVEKRITVSITESAGKYIAEQDAIAQANKNAKMGFWAWRRARKAQKNAPPSFEELIAKKIRSASYAENEMLVVDVEKGKLCAKVVQVPQTKEEK